MHLRSLVIPFALLAAVLAFAGTAFAKRHAARTTTVKVSEKEFKFVLSKSSVPAGRVTFVIKNVGKISHDFEIAGRKSKTLAAGKSTTLTVTLKKGKDPYKCTIDSHAKLGMKGVLRVT